MLKLNIILSRLIMCGLAILLWSGCGKNNSQDVMHAAVNHKIEIVNPDGALDENFGEIREIQARPAMSELFECMMEDSKGYFHVTFWGENDRHSYMIISPEGELVFESGLGEGLVRFVDSLIMRMNIVELNMQYITEIVG